MVRSARVGLRPCLQRFDQLNGEPTRDEGHGAVHGVGLCNGNDVGFRLACRLLALQRTGEAFGPTLGALKRFEHGLPAINQGGEHRPAHWHDDGPMQEVRRFASLRRHERARILALRVTFALLKIV
ncbi:MULTISPECIES: hypothetical protein [unclassified Hyphomonas]|jgi:hypothetical protein|uniref:hypothetical protein n=1 Tax=unclassified Hyphomonas TaxID=2630699 RepID=UPI000458D026|nr:MULTISPECIES: hypothetical protein [unclassified Hyphomonas]KCZ49239.1 hypothetical protein HY17_14415 [Hyphomonas sp. CY54-11-8]